jgi:hypothetical protein
MPENLCPCSSMNEPVPALQASFFQADVFCVLTADLKDCVHARVVKARSFCVGCDFVQDEYEIFTIAGNKERTDNFPSAPGDTQSDDPIHGIFLFEEPQQQ